KRFVIDRIGERPEFSERKVVALRSIRPGYNADECDQNERTFCAYTFHFFGSFCFSLSTGSKRSPFFSTRARTWSERNFKRSAFFFFEQLATSSQVTGVETLGSSLARSE